MEPKPGWKTSEFWVTLGSQLLALIALLGVVNQADVPGLSEAWGKAVAAVFVVIAQVFIVVRYIASRTEIKTTDPAPLEGGDPHLTSDAEPTTTGPGTPSAPLVFFLAALAAGAMGGAVQAAPILAPPRVIEERSYGPACWGQSRPQTDPAMMAILQEISRQNAQIIQLLMGLQSQQGQLLGLQQRPYYTPPQQQLPILGQPQQALPIQGQPQQALPIQGQPQQGLPIQGPPQQGLPQQGLPQQQLDPGGSKPAPAGYQRYEQSTQGGRPIIVEEWMDHNGQMIRRVIGAGR